MSEIIKRKPGRPRKNPIPDGHVAPKQDRIVIDFDEPNPKTQESPQTTADDVSLIDEASSQKEIKHRKPAEEKPKRPEVICQQWLEPSTSAWNKVSAGYSYHLSEEDLREFIKQDMSGDKPASRSSKVEVSDSTIVVLMAVRAMDKFGIKLTSNDSFEDQIINMMPEALPQDKQDKFLHVKASEWAEHLVNVTNVHFKGITYLYWNVWSAVPKQFQNVLDKDKFKACAFLLNKKDYDECKYSVGNAPAKIEFKNDSCLIVDYRVEVIVEAYKPIDFGLPVDMK